MFQKSISQSGLIFFNSSSSVPYFVSAVLLRFLYCFKWGFFIVRPTFLNLKLRYFFLKNLTRPLPRGMKTWAFAAGPWLTIGDPLKDMILENRTQKKTSINSLEFNVHVWQVEPKTVDVCKQGDRKGFNATLAALSTANFVALRWGCSSKPRVNQLWFQCDSVVISRRDIAGGSNLRCKRRLHSYL